MNNLWTEKYRPKTIAEYVWMNDSQRDTVSKWISAKEIPHVLLTGAPGTGKTTLAYILMNELGVSPSNVLFMNASHENSVDDVREKVDKFCRTTPYDGQKFRYVILDESDELSPQAQKTLRGITEVYSSVSRFIMTANYENKIIPALKDRFQGFHITGLDKKAFLTRIIGILKTEGISFETELIPEYVNASYPSLRRCLNLLQQNISDGVLSFPSAGNDATDFKLAIIDLFRDKKYEEARKYIVNNIRKEEFVEFYDWLGDNTHIWAGDDISKQQDAIIEITTGARWHSMTANVELNLSAVLINLEKITRK